MRERVTWNGEREDFVEDGEADLEDGRPSPRKRLALVGEVSGSRGGLDAAVVAALAGPDERRMETEPSLQPRATPGATSNLTSG